MSSSDAPPPESRLPRPFVVRPTSGSGPEVSPPRPTGRISRPFVPRIVQARDRPAPSQPGVASPSRSTPPVEPAMPIAAEATSSPPRAPDVATTAMQRPAEHSGQPPMLAGEPPAPASPADAPGDPWADRPLSQEPAAATATPSDSAEPALAAPRAESAGSLEAAPWRPTESAGDVSADRNRERQRTVAGPPSVPAVVPPAEAWPQDVWPDEEPHPGFDPAAPLGHESPPMLGADLATDLSTATSGTGTGLGGADFPSPAGLPDVGVAEQPGLPEPNAAASVAERLEQLAEQLRAGTLPAGNVNAADARAGMRDSELLVALLGAVLKAGR